MFSYRYPAVVLLASVIAGTILGKYLAIPWVIIIGLSAFAFIYLVFVFLGIRRMHFIVGVSLLCVGLGMGNAVTTFRVFPADDIGEFAGSGKSMRFFGRIDCWPALRQNRTMITCAVDSIVRENAITPVSGAILISVERMTTAFQRGDYISFTGRLRSVESVGLTGLFEYASYLNNKGIRGTVIISDPVTILRSVHDDNIFGTIIGAVRRWIVGCFYVNLSDVSAAMASGFLIGETHDIPEEIYLAFRKTGTMHLLAVSGSNVALVLLVVIAIMRYLPLNRIARFMALCAIIIAFSHLSYNQPSVVRASVMAIVVLFARVVYRRGDLNNLIAVAAVTLILFDPANLFDIGFQLSFAVTWGLVLFVPEMNALIRAHHLSNVSRYLTLIVFCSLVATLVASPITVYYFGEFSAVTVFSNMLVVPLVSAAVVGIVILLLCALIYPPLAMIPGIGLDRLLIWTNDIVAWFGQWESSSLSVPPIPLWSVFASLVFVTMLLFSIRHLFFRRMIVFGIVSAAIFLFGASAMRRGEVTPEVIIDSSGSTRTLVFNISDGLVVTEANYDSPRDDFVSRIFPYLIYNNDIIPRYYLFREPEYRIHQRLDILTETYPDLHFIPEDIPGESVRGRLYRMTGSKRIGRSGSLAPTELSMTAGIMVLAHDHWRITTIEPDTVSGLLAIPSQGVSSLLIIHADALVDCGQIPEFLSAKRVVVLTGKEAGDCNWLIDNMFSRDSGFDDATIIGRGDCVKVPVEAVDYFPHY